MNISTSTFVVDVSSNFEPLDVCQQETSTLTLWVGIVLIVGSFVASFPQFVSILRRRSSNGLSEIYLSLGIVSVALTTLSSGILNWRRVECCAQLAVGDCLALNLPFMQMFFVFVWFLVLYGLFVRFCVVDANLDALMVRRTKRRAKILALIVLVCVALAVVVTLALHYATSRVDTEINAFATYVGLTGAVVLATQYVPQIVKLCSLRDSGSLSVTSLLLTLPGHVLTVIFQGVLQGGPVSAWLPAFFAGSETAILIVLVVVFWLIRVKNGKSGFSADDIAIRFKEEDVPIDEDDVLQQLLFNQKS
jgi:uncharacterized protein with PQ loop repeat